MTGPDLRLDRGDVPDGVSTRTEDDNPKLEEERAKIMVKIAEALEGDAQRIAHGIGIDTYTTQRRRITSFCDLLMNLLWQTSRLHVEQRP